jgi:hypothetical protein
MSGKVERFSATKKTVILKNDGFEAVLSLDEHGKQKTWLLTGWKKKEPDATGEVGARSGATQNGPTFSRADMVAGSESNIRSFSDIVNDS